MYFKSKGIHKEKWRIACLAFGASHAIRHAKSYFKKGGELIINYQLEYYEKKSYMQFVFTF